MSVDSIDSHSWAAFPCLREKAVCPKNPSVATVKLGLGMKRKPLIVFVVAFLNVCNAAQKFQPTFYSLILQL